jgi:radical SAM protein with 4Fe4S-binding SPASM domain
VLTNRNVGDVLRIAERVRSLGIDDFHFQPVWKQHFVPEHLKHSVLDNFNDVFGFTKGNRALLEEAARLIELARSSNDPAYTALFADFYLGTERAKAIECWAGRAFLFIDADGNVRPCGSVPDTFGNILAPDFESTFEERFESHRARELKRQLAKQSCGGCASVCYMERNILMETTRDPVKLVGVVRKRLLR